MTKHLITAATLLALGSSGAFAMGHAGNTGYALAGDGGTLVVMADIAAPDMIETVALETPVDAIAYRPVTGDLLAVTDGMLFTIDPATGAMTDLGAMFKDGAMLGDGAMVAFDFNNKIDAVRAVSSAGDNLVYFPEGFGDKDDRAGSVIRMTDLAYAEGDMAAGTTPMVFANAYTNAISGAKASATFQYGIDAATDSLISIANNAGTLESIAKITFDGEEVDLSAMGGFDIISPEEGTDAAFAILQREGAQSAGLYTIDLTSGAATRLADLGMGGFSGFAVSMGM